MHLFGFKAVIVCVLQTLNRLHGFSLVALGCEQGGVEPSYHFITQPKRKMRDKIWK